MVKEMKVKTYELNLWCGYFYELIKKGIQSMFQELFSYSNSGIQIRISRHTNLKAT